MGYKSRGTDMCTVPLWSYNLGLICHNFHFDSSVVRYYQMCSLSHNHISIGEIQMED